MQKFKMTRNIVILLCTMFFLILCSHMVLADESCKVVFANSKGIVSNDKYLSWGKTVKKGTTITLPKHSVDGYTSYWVLKTANGNVKYKPGASYKVNSNVKFYMYYYKITPNTIKFYSNSGTKCYTGYTLKAIKGSYITLPEIVSTDTKYGSGWALKKGQKTAKYKPGTKIKVTGDMRFYVVYVNIRTVRLYWPDGKLYKKLVLKNGDTANFPSVISKTGGMILGWSKEKGKHNKPDYYVENSIPTSANTYYMVEYRVSDEPVISASKLISPKKYKHVFIVGDSRTVFASQCIKNEVQNVTFIARSGKGLDWLRGTDVVKPGGYYMLIQSLRKMGKSEKKAVVFNLGVNDLWNCKAYAQYLNQIAVYLKQYNCDLYYMSVNPVNEAMITNCKNKVSYRAEQKVIEFNRMIQLYLNDSYYTYIDTCTPLRRSGWISAVNQNGISDGIHYSLNTYRRIYNYMMNYIETNQK